MQYFRLSYGVRLFCIGLLLISQIGCARWRGRGITVPEDSHVASDEIVSDSLDGVPVLPASLQREEPDVSSPTLPAELATEAPLTLDAPRDYVDLNLTDAIRFGLQNSEVIADVGGAMLRSSSNVATVFDPAIQEANPRTGVIGALSQFDTSFTARLFAENNDRQLNNTFLGGGTRALQQDAAVVEWGFDKRTAAGTQLWLGSTMDYDNNNAPGNEFRHAYNAIIGAEIRQPLLRGGGLDFNRIAGPAGIPGSYNGVLVSRIDTDISLAKFEASVRDYVSRVEDAYWELYFAYRNLDAKVRARDAALDTWRRIQALAESNRRGGEAVRETQARDQLQRLEVEVQNALVGRLVEGTQTSSGTLGSAFRGTSGIHVADRRLRLLIGKPINDGALLRPMDEPPMAAVQYDWQETLRDALTQRVEVRQQKSLVKRRELEYVASKNYLKPKLDLVFQHQVRGFGRNLLDETATGSRSGAFNQLANLDHQESQFGVDVEIPIGNRQGSTTVRHAELQLRRERAVLSRLERQITHDVSNAVSNLTRAQAVMQSTFGSLEAAQERLQATQSAFDLGNATLDLLLDAQRRLAAAESEFYRALVEHMLAAKTVELKKGTLLDYNGIHLAESGWSENAISQVARRHSKERILDTALVKPGRVISSGIVSDRPSSYVQTVTPVTRPLPVAPPEYEIPQNPIPPAPGLLPPPGEPPATTAPNAQSIAPLLDIPPPGMDLGNTPTQQLIAPPKKPR
ncbi:MAG: TolC family protein [Planctomycetaceae bacterium]